MRTHLPPRWAPRLLQLLGAPVNTENLDFLNAWAQAEGGNAVFNPLNTTYPLPFGESWAYNNSKVQNYWTATGGVAATGLTLVQSNLAPLLGDLQSGHWSAEQIVRRNEVIIKTIWGTNPETILAVLKERRSTP